jgi:hypothetical protein
MGSCRREVGMRRLSVVEKEFIAQRVAAGVPSRRIAREMGRAAYGPCPTCDGLGVMVVDEDADN